MTNMTNIVSFRCSGGGVGPIPPHLAIYRVMLPHITYTAASFYTTKFIVLHWLIFCIIPNRVVRKGSNNKYYNNRIINNGPAPSEGDCPLFLSP